MTKWEYQQVAANQELLGKALEDLGRQGWELSGMAPIAVQAGPLDPGPPRPGFLLVFKRPVAIEAENGQPVNRIKMEQ